MIIYNSKNWLGAISHFHTSYIIRLTFRYVLIIGLYATAVAAFYEVFDRLHEGKFDLGIDPIVYSLLGIFLSFTMVFRINSSYDRWWEGRKQWGALVNHTRGLAVLMNGILQENDLENRRFFARALAAYVLSLKDHLRDVANHHLIGIYSTEPEGAYKNLNHLPNKIVNDMYSRMERLYQEGRIDGYQLINLKPETQSFLDIQGACERIKATPIPFSHNFFIKLFILLYLLLLPFVLTPTFSDSSPFLIIPLVMLVTYALVGIENISIEVEEPFGTDCNDLPTEALAVKISQNVHEILGIDELPELPVIPTGMYAKQH